MSSTRTFLATYACVAALGLLLAAADKADPAPVKLDTAKFWRMVARASQLRQAANQTPQAKAADAADEEVKKAQAELEAKCGTGFSLVLDSDPASPTHDDVVCKKNPPPPEPPKAKP